MITTKLYEDQEGNLVAVVLEDGQYTNYISSPEVVAFEGDSFIEDARMGFPDAFPYEYDMDIGLTLEEAAAREEQESALIVQIDDKITIYPRRMGPYTQEFFQSELGEDIWQELLDQVSGDEGAELDL